MNPFTRLVCTWTMAIAMLLLNVAGFSQPGTPAPGKADIAELNLKQCSFDTAASAMYLLNSQETTLDPMRDGSYWTTTKRRARIKIFNKQGFEYGTIRFPVRTGRRRKLSDVNGYIYYTDSTGRIITQKITRQDIFKDKVSEKVTTIAFTFPNLKPGCVIEFSYTYLEKYSAAIPPFIFQSQIPTALAWSKVACPYGRQLEHKIISKLPVDAEEEDKTVKGDAMFVRSYVVKNIPAFEPEPLMSSFRDNLQRIEFSLNFYPGFLGLTLKEDEKWKPINRVVHMFTEAQAETKLAGTDSIINKAKSLKTVPEKVELIFSYLKKKMKWNEDETFLAFGITDAWNEKEGDNAELNTILFNLLRRSGVKCSPLLISSRENGKIDQQFINPGQFSGMDVLVIDSIQNFVLDLTQKNLSYKTTPYNIINTTALLVDSLKGNWVDINDYRALYQQSLIVFSMLDSTGVLKGSATIEYFDYAKDVQLTMKEKEKEMMKENYKSFQEDEQKITTSNFVSEQADNDALPLIERFDFEFELSAADKFYLLNPSFLASFRKNPFVSDKRSFDIDFGSNQMLVINLNLALPANFALEELPKNVTLRKSDSTMIFKRLFSRSNDRIQGLIQLQYLANFFPKEDYADLKEFFTAMYRLLNEPIILRRKN